MIPRMLFGEDHEIFRAMVRRFIAAEITPRHAEWERAGIVPREVWLQAGEAGLLCTGVPEEYGGMGGDFLHSTILVEEMARAGATAPTFYLHSEIVAPYLVRYGTEEQKHRWLPRMAKGEIITALGMSEPSGGSDLQSMKTVALRDGEDYVINGQKVFITAGFNADLLVLACKTDPKQKAKGVSLILVETDRPGFQRGRKLEKIGCKGQDTAELFFADLTSSNLQPARRGRARLLSVDDRIAAGASGSGDPRRRPRPKRRWNGRSNMPCSARCSIKR